MPSAKVAEAYVEIGAKLDKLDRDMDRTKREVVKRMEDAGQQAGEGFASKLAKGFAALAFVESTAKLGSAALKGIRGDAEGAAEAIGSLPFGIGPAATAVADFGQELNGAAADARRLSIQVQLVEERTRRFDATIKALEIGDALDAQINIERLEGLPKVLAQIEESRRKQVLATRQALEAQRAEPRIIDQTIEKINKLAATRAQAARAREDSAAYAERAKVAQGGIESGDRLVDRAEALEAGDPFERERILARQRAEAREAEARKLEKADSSVAERFREQAERLHKAELADIARREKEKARVMAEARERELRAEEDKYVAEVERKARERKQMGKRLAQQFDRIDQENRRRDEALASSQFTIDTGGDRNIRNATTSIRGGGSIESIAKATRPQEIKSKTLDEIKTILARIETSGGGFG